MLDMHGVIGSIPIVSTTTQTHYLEYFSKGLFSKIWRISKEIRHIFCIGEHKHSAYKEN